MSRIGNRKLEIPKQVDVVLETNILTVSGPKGKLVRRFGPEIVIEVDKEQKFITTKRFNDEKRNKQLHGTTNALINLMLKGVADGFEKVLEINGVGYRASVEGRNLKLTLGYSHPIVYQIPEGIEITTPKQNLLKISGYNKELVGLVAAKIRDYRKPEPYKGKGIKYQDKNIRRKEGKSSAKGK